MADTDKAKHGALLPIDGVGELLDTGPRRIRRLIAERLFPHHKFGGLVRFDRRRSIGG